MGKVKSFTVHLCERNEIRDFIEHWHYSHNINGLSSKYCFRLMDGDTLIGGMIYGQPAMAGAWKPYVDHRDELIELRRLCCIDDTPKNTESYFIGHTLRWLKKNTTIKKVISYADQTYGHEGTIYKATHFQHVGMTAPCRVICYDGKKYHDKTIRTKYNGKLKPYAQRLKDALERGEAHYERTKPKHIYIYHLV